MAEEPFKLGDLPHGPANLMDCSVLAKRPRRTSCQVDLLKWEYHISPFRRDLQMKITYADFDGFGDLPHKSSGISTLKHIVLQRLT